jgi:hypothetical protein
MVRPYLGYVLKKKWSMAFFFFPLPDFTEEVTIEQVIVPENEDVFSLEAEVNFAQRTYRI